jgi:hypothetical protein
MVAAAIASLEALQGLLQLCKQVLVVLNGKWNIL